MKFQYSFFTIIKINTYLFLIICINFILGKITSTERLLLWFNTLYGRNTYMMAVVSILSVTGPITDYMDQERKQGIIY